MASNTVYVAPSNRLCQGAHTPGQAPKAQFLPGTPLRLVLFLAENDARRTAGLTYCQICPCSRTKNVLSAKTANGLVHFHADELANFYPRFLFWEKSIR